VNTARTVIAREIVVKKKVLDVFETPCIEFDDWKLVKVEVANHGLGQVFVNGVLFRGFKLHHYETHYRSGVRDSKTHVILQGPAGTMDLVVDALILLDGELPNSAVRVETVDAQ
jgi:hypothetical protein